MNSTMSNMYKQQAHGNGRREEPKNVSKKKAKIGKQEKSMGRDLFVIDNKPSPISSDVALDATTAGELTDTANSVTPDRSKNLSVTLSCQNAHHTMYNAHKNILI